MAKKKIIAVIGPTGSGKTALGEALCLEFNGEIISVDAKQVYRRMDIGTAKEKVLKVPQHLIDIKDPGEKITVAEFQALAYEKIEDVFARGKQPFLVGCSMLYTEAITNGYIFTEGSKSNEQDPRYETLKIGVKVENELLQSRRAERTQQWVRNGLIEEIQGLLDSGVSREWLESCGQEYRFFTQYIFGDLTLEQAIEKTNISLNQYTKRQYTWWRRHDNVVWIQEPTEATSIVRAFLGH